MQGRRVDWPEDMLPIEIEKQLQPGDYAGPWHGKYMLCVPNGDMGCIDPSIHSITEHDDRTITIAPSILIHPLENVYKGWHGYLERGVWREC